MDQSGINHYMVMDMVKHKKQSTTLHFYSLSKNVGSERLSKQAKMLCMVFVV